MHIAYVENRRMLCVGPVSGVHRTRRCGVHQDHDTSVVEAKSEHIMHLLLLDACSMWAPFTNVRLVPTNELAERKKQERLHDGESQNGALGITCTAST
jgi:hypothetical protein